MSGSLSLQTVNAVLRAAGPVLEEVVLCEDRRRHVGHGVTLLEHSSYLVAEDEEQYEHVHTLQGRSYCISPNQHNDRL